jgi:hypothetical protein
MPDLDWQAEHNRFMAIVYPATLKAAKRAFWYWRYDKRDDAIQECLAKMWDQYSRLRQRGRTPENLEKSLGSLIMFSLLWVRDNRRLAGRRARTPDVFDYRAGFKQQQFSDDGQACPSDRSDPRNPWINWNTQTGDDPAELTAALETSGVSLAQWCDL